MGKKRQFIEEDVLDKLVIHFWKHGYSATKVDQLSEVTGLTKTSLYNAFGNKEALFLNALNYYVENTLKDLVGSLDKSMSLSFNIEKLLKSSFSLCDREVLDFGCLLTNSIVELNGNEPKLHEAVVKLYDRVREVKYKLISYYSKAGHISKEYKADELTDYYMTVWQGLRVQSRNDHAAEKLDNSIQVFLKFIKSIER